MKKNKFNFFENAWGKKTYDYDETGKNDPAVKKQKRINRIIAVFSVVCAFLIWIYASSVHVTEIKYQSTVNMKRVSSVESKGYTVEYNTGVKVNYTIRGTVFAISQLPSKGVDVYADLSTVNLSEITDMKISVTDMKKSTSVDAEGEGRVILSGKNNRSFAGDMGFKSLPGIRYMPDYRV